MSKSNTEKKRKKNVLLYWLKLGVVVKAAVVKCANSYIHNPVMHLFKPVIPTYFTMFPPFIRYL